MASWNVVVDGRNYEIKQKAYSLVINGEKTKLKDLMSKKDGIYKVYEVPLGSKKAHFYVNSWVGGTKLAMDGIDCATGAPFTPPKMPKWAYVFMVIHCLNFANGAVGALLAIVGIMATISNFQQYQDAGCGQSPFGYPDGHRVRGGGVCGGFCHGYSIV